MKGLGFRTQDAQDHHIGNWNLNPEPTTLDPKSERAQGIREGT